jgi:hypothetical protein
MKTKSVIVIVLTLVIGFVLGMLTSAQLRYQKLKPVRVFFSEERFREGFYNAIQPDAMQKEKIDVILDKYAKLNSELQDNFRKDMEQNMKEFRKEIDQNLTKDQLSRLKDLDEKRKEMIRQYRNMNHDADSSYMGPGRRRFRDFGPGHGPGPGPGSDSGYDAHPVHPRDTLNSTGNI